MTNLKQEEVESKRQKSPFQESKTHQRTLLQRIKEQESILESYTICDSDLLKVQLYPTFVSGKVIVHDNNISKMRFELQKVFSKLPYLGSVKSEFDNRYRGFEEAILNVARHVVLPSKTSPDISSDGIYFVECPVFFWFYNNGNGHEVYGSSDLFISHDVTGHIVPREIIDSTMIRLETLSELLRDSNTIDPLEQKSRDIKLAQFFLEDCKKRKLSSGTGLYMIQQGFNSTPDLFEDGTIHIKISPVRYDIPVRVTIPKYRNN